MRLLLDTHVFLWVATDSRKLKAPAREFVRAASAVFVSSASIWEIAIKTALGKLQVDPEALVREIDVGGFIELPVSARHAARVARLPPLHNDPFDRLLVAQALCEPLILLTADKLLCQYGPVVQPV